MSDAPPLTPKPCKKCGSPGEVMKAGSNRFWVECAKFGRNGNCNVISAQAPNRKAAIQNWNANCA
ncbi:Lar family restriction alleviation protein [Chitinimonas naiadis]